MLTQTVSTQEIDDAMLSISVDSAPGLDGMSFLFFRKTWPIVKDDIYSMVKEFFIHCYMYKPVNYTSITLIPKALHVTSIKQFRPISCCIVLYRIVAKILAKRLRLVIGDIVNPAQSGFIPGRQIVDNILLASELIKGYRRKGLSPRCFVKIDLKKAYGSVECGFLRTMMQELGSKSIGRMDHGVYLNCVL